MKKNPDKLQLFQPIKVTSIRPKPNLNQSAEYNQNMLGFTLIEVMLSITIMAVIISIAVPSYNHYVTMNDQLLARQQALYIANYLEQWQARHLTYSGFSLTEHQNSGQNFKYLITLTDATGERPLTHIQARAEGWRMLIYPDPQGSKPNLLDSYYLDSFGKKCFFNSKNVAPDITHIGVCRNHW